MRWKLSEGGGSLTTYHKQVLFLRHAATAPEPLVAKADDDVFVSPRLLIAHAQLLNRMLRKHPHLYMGAFEYYSWRRSSLVATGWERTRRDAFFKAQDRNCSPSGRGWAWNGFDYEEIPPSVSEGAMDRDGCVGPFAFAKGPFYFLSQPALQWLLSSQAFAEDYGRADDRHIVRGSDPWHRDVPSDDASPEQLFEDVQMGFWLSAHPTLQIVRLKQYSAWCDVWKHVGDLRQLLVAHRAPWDQYAWLDRHMESLWASGSHVVIRMQCGGPPCTGCAHSRGQRACVVEVELARTEGQASVGCKQCVCRAYYPESGRIYKSGSRCSQDYWAGEPKLPRDCRGATSEGPS